MYYEVFGVSVRVCIMWWRGECLITYAKLTTLTHESWDDFKNCSSNFYLSILIRTVFNVIVVFNWGGGIESTEETCFYLQPNGQSSGVRFEHMSPRWEAHVPTSEISRQFLKQNSVPELITKIHKCILIYIANITTRKKKTCAKRSVKNYFLPFTMMILRVLTLYHNYTIQRCWSKAQSYYIYSHIRFFFKQPKSIHAITQTFWLQIRLWCFQDVDCAARTFGQMYIYRVLDSTIALAAWPLWLHSPNLSSCRREHKSGTVVWQSNKSQKQ